MKTLDRLGKYGDQEMFDFFEDVYTNAINSFEHGNPILEEARLQEVVKALDRYLFKEKDGADFV